MSAAQGLDRVHVLMSDSPGSAFYLGNHQTFLSLSLSICKMGLPIVVAPTPGLGPATVPPR